MIAVVCPLDSKCRQAKKLRLFPNKAFLIESASDAYHDSRRFVIHQLHDSRIQK